ncbi:HMG domain-containing protein 3 [Microcaecilia unicolor]|uniref:HMG domain-containing protein 3 n=1 Tax=Microcaecilia unicolor TaxID=1415580 RepID=A0A6P7YXF0_9AMPH|nr:HMG domain-containing protein 3 [Microcaecilia unicolor]XP_030068134.1 HMG domain-containing protein 3 [Microcaecilia unicolor]
MDAPYDGTEVTVVSEEVETGYTYVSSGPPKKKKKYRGNGDQGEKAKKPRSAYLLYYYDIYLKVQQELPHLPHSEINKKISESWRLLSVAEKSYYLEKAKLEKEGVDPNSNYSSPTVVSDVPGFRKILPRSDYVIIPKTALQEGRSRHHVELCGPVVRSSSTVSQDAVQSILSVVPSHVSVTEQCITIEGLEEESSSFGHSNGGKELVTSELLSQYVSPVADKVTDDIILDEATLELEDSHQYQAASVVIEDTLVGSPTGGIAMSRPQIPDGMSVLTVLTEQEPNEFRPAVPTSQFIMLPLTHPSVDSAPSIKLTSTYTRRGRGNCTSAGCTFTYVTRHKPPKCPLCGSFLGGKWVPKEKKEMGKTQQRIASPAKVPATKRCQSTPESTPVRENFSKSSQESTEAVSQLLNTVAFSKQLQEAEWEEVVISEDYLLERELKLTGHDIAAQTNHVLASDSLTQEQVVNEAGKRTPPEVTSNKEPPQLPATTLMTSVGIDSSIPAAAQRGSDLKGKTRTRSSLLAAARPTRAILPAPASSAQESVTDQAGSRQIFLINDKHSLVGASGLKPSTLKQLGHSVQQSVSSEKCKVQSISRPQLKVLDMKPDAFPTFKYSCTLNLGLATSRGRGKCKNPSCSYVYTNRHKPRVCPICGYSLAKEREEKITQSLDSPSTASEMRNPNNPLSQSEKETQRQSTLQLLRKTVQVPENESELTEVFTLIHDLNSSRLILSNVSEETVTIEQTSWSNYYESPAMHCLLCSSPLFKGAENSLASPQDCWLLTANRLQMVTAQVKVCLNPQCLALHSFTDIYTGLFNVGNKLLVSLDLLFAIRNHIKMGEDPKVSVSSILESVQEQTEKPLSPEEWLLLQELLCSGYWAFECLTIRDFNDMICGICGIAPKVEIAQRNTENVLALKNVEFTWPEFLASSEVNMEDFWSTMETEVIEQAAFPSSIPITKFDASIIAPFFAPLMRGAVVVNTEKDKNPNAEPVPGNGSALVKLLQKGLFKIEDINLCSKEELQHLLTLCGIHWSATDTKDKLRYSLVAFYEFVQNGTGSNQPPTHLTGGKVYKVCPHQVVCGSKYIVRGESARDHVDLLVSSHHWPPVYVVDMATQVALCADISYPELTAQMWGKNQGCFSNPSEPSKYVSCPELLERHYSVDMTVTEFSIQHPITKSTSRRIAHAGTEQSTQNDPTIWHHALSLCRELEPYSAIITAINDSKTSNIRQRGVTFDNATHYYLYNRLIDFLTSRDIVNRQIHEIVQSCQPGEVVIRDTLYRLGVAQIKTETEDSPEEDEGEEDVTEQPLNPL